MHKLLVVSALLAFVTPALAQMKPGQFSGVHKCTGTLGTMSVDVTSKKTIGVATCKTELKKRFVADGACKDHKKNDKLIFSFQFGDDKDPAKATGDFFLLC